MLKSTRMLLSLMWHLLETLMLLAARSMFAIPGHQILNLGKRQAVMLSQEECDRGSEEKETFPAD